MKVAVIGSGIAGLTCAWLLSQNHDVTIYERAPFLGMDAHHLDVSVDGETVSVDVPVRVSSPFYYPNLFRLYRHVGIEMQPVTYGSSFIDHRGDSYFHFTNLKVTGMSLPFVRPTHLFSKAGIRIGLDILRLGFCSRAYLKDTEGEPLTLREFFNRFKFGDPFVKTFICPVMSALCSCSYDTVLGYPAEIVLDVFAGGFLHAPLFRVHKGSGHVVRTLSAKVEEIQLESDVSEVTRIDEKMRVGCADGSAALFDHVVIATQTNQALHFVKGLSVEERKVLEFLPL